MSIIDTCFNAIMKVNCILASLFTGFAFAGRVDVMFLILGCYGILFLIMGSVFCVSLLLE